MRHAFSRIVNKSFRKSPKYLPLALAAGCGFAVFHSTPASAAFEDEITKVTTMSTTLQGVISGITEAAIAPIGLAAAFGMFKMMVLRAV